ncbi:IPT/TIG domain-containing protein [Streptomyces sp. NPDC088135]|uniref:IPT/TIG domain-containing protein n=1 Tax=Streptomyces sp. NPDC088135 TaxID=3160993 RepID=UPI00341B1B0C
MLPSASPSPSARSSGPQQPKSTKSKGTAATADGPTTNDAVYAYDAAGRLVGVSDPEGETAHYRYDATGNRLGIDRFPSSDLSVLSLVPASAATGATVTISGTGFATTPTSNTVTFGSATAEVVSATTTRSRPRCLRERLTDVSQSRPAVRPFSPWSPSAQPRRHPQSAKWLRHPEWWVPKSSSPDQVLHQQ